MAWRCLTLSLVCLSATISFAQGPVKRGRWFLSWGWNRSAYTTSDIHFTGADYDLTLHDVRATDRPTPVSMDYMNPLQLTVPQTDLRIGWFFRDHYSIALGFDHMKYVMSQDQVVRADGHIDDSGPFAGSSYDNEEITLTEDFLKFEHSDGLNFIHLELARHDRLAHVEALRMDVTVSEGIDAGVLVPRTASRFLGMPLSDRYHLSGFGLAAKAGFNLTFFDLFFVGMDLKGGYIGLPDIRTSNNTSDRAEQHFAFVEGIVLFGVTLDLGKEKEATKTP